MKKADSDYRAFLDILKEELIPAGGCTEPIAIAYTAAVARKTLGCRPEHMDVYASGNLIKNAKGVYIPNGGELRGVDAAAILGALGGNADRMLEVLLDLPDGVLDETQALMQQNYCKVHVIQGSEALHLIVNVQADGQTAEVELKNAHTHIVRIEKNGESVFRAEEDGTQDGFTDHSCLTVEKIVDFANTCDLADIEPTLQKQIDCNMQIAEEGLNNRWGVNVGKLYYENGKLLQAYAAAASDARMSGCELPVCIVSGSGNQGITASVPVAVYAKELNVGEEKTIRAVLLSDLLTIHLKTGIGRLSAYCGAVSAGCAAGAAIAWLHGGGYAEIAHTLVNALAITSGIVCDGAKPSCAAKIATAVETGILGYEMYCDGQQFYSGEGLVGKGVERTIRNIGRLGREGMRATDEEILRIMTQCV